MAAEGLQLLAAPLVVPNEKATEEAAEGAQKHRERKAKHREVGLVALAGQHVGADQGDAPEPEKRRNVK